MTLQPTQQQQQQPQLARKRLEGVKTNKDLKLLIEEALQLGIPTASASKDVNEDKENNNTNNNCSRTVVQQALQPLPTAKAVLILEGFTKDNADTLKKAKVIPIPVIRALYALFQKDAVRTDRLGKALRQQQHKEQQSLQKSILSFTSPPDNNNNNNNQLTPEQIKFQKRMERLRLQQEETKYSKLTANVGTRKGANDDDINTRSMTYAASIGLNMIIAPISFGCFMYFFAGSILDFFWSKDTDSTATTTNSTVHTPDIRKVIMGVVSGVAMLFIEMILFVIRTHEMDKAARKKSKKNKQGPFGYYTADTSKTFVGK